MKFESASFFRYFCSCYHNPIDNFCEVADDQHYIVLAVMLNTAEYQFDEYRKVRILTELNKSTSEDAITIMGGNPVACGYILD